jgi:hypothetical protein
MHPDLVSELKSLALMLILRIFYYSNMRNRQYLEFSSTELPKAQLVLYLLNQYI